jgi:hypothetical protein
MAAKKNVLLIHCQIWSSMIVYAECLEFALAHLSCVCQSGSCHVSASAKKSLEVKTTASIASVRFSTVTLGNEQCLGDSVSWVVKWRNRTGRHLRCLPIKHCSLEDWTGGLLWLILSGPPHLASLMWRLRGNTGSFLGNAEGRKPFLSRFVFNCTWVILELIFLSGCSIFFIMKPKCPRPATDAIFSLWLDCFVSALGTFDLKWRSRTAYQQWNPGLAQLSFVLENFELQLYSQHSSKAVQRSKSQRTWFWHWHEYWRV